MATGTDTSTAAGDIPWDDGPDEIAGAQFCPRCAGTLAQIAVGRRDRARTITACGRCGWPEEDSRIDEARVVGNRYGARRS